MLLFPVGQSLHKALENMPKIAQAYQQLATTITTDTYTNTHPQVEEVRVDMAAMKVESKPVELLTSVGSCIAICMYDSAHKCGGLAHIMLPQSAHGSLEPLPSKYADTAVPALVRSIQRKTGAQNRLIAKIAGGANMFANTCVNNLDIGAKNAAAVKSALKEHKIRLIGEDVGGSHGRRVTFNIASGLTTIRTYSGETKQI